MAKDSGFRLIAKKDCVAGGLARAAASSSGVGSDGVIHGNLELLEPGIAGIDKPIIP